MDNLKEKIRSYFVEKKDVIAVYLFGSYAKGKARFFSDVDIGIMFASHDQRMMVKERDDCIVELGRILRRDIHPVILNLAGEGLLRQVFSKGECLLINDKGKHAYEKMVMFVKMSEFAYYGDQMRKSLVARVTEGEYDG